ncbi:alpha/beta hydrolase [Streptomyces bobili]|uniref:alpha/beta hydrolase n=1 Tax=Streptomyces bobili TaxID=67280 RepID=UPI00365CCC61
MTLIDRGGSSDVHARGRVPSGGDQAARGLRGASRHRAQPGTLIARRRPYQSLEASTWHFHEQHGEQTVDLYIKPALFGDVFAHDLAPATADQLAASQRPIALSALLEPSGPPAWKSLPSWYVLGTRDHILPPDRQRSMARRARSRIIEVAGSHLVMLSRPDAVVDVIVSAARGTA